MASERPLPIQEYPDGFYCINQVFLGSITPADVGSDTSGGGDTQLAMRVPLALLDRQTVVDSARLRVEVVSTTNNVTARLVAVKDDAAIDTDLSANWQAVSGTVGVGDEDSPSGEIAGNKQDIPINENLHVNVVPADYLLCLEFSGAITALEDLSVRVRCRERRR